MACLDLINLKSVEFAYFVALCILIYSVATSTVSLYFTCTCVLFVCLKLIRKKSTGRIDSKQRAVFITGCDTGFGHDLARRLDSLHFTVFAGCLNPEGEGATQLKANSSNNLHVVPLDVSSDTSVKVAHDYVVQKLPDKGLWAIVNNAGIGMLGDVELCTIKMYKKIMNINYFGAIRTIQNFLYLVRKTKGRVVIVSSVRGRFTFPGNSAYHITKHGLETVADCLRLEMLKFGVDVAIIEPGNFSMFQRYREETDEMWEAATDGAKQTYGRKYIDAVYIKNTRRNTGGASSTKPVIDALEDDIVSTRPHTRYLVDGGTWFDPNTTLARYYAYLPAFLADWIIVKRTGCDKFPDYSELKLE